MASNRHTPRLVRLAVVSAISSLTVAVLPGTVAHAAPGVLAKPAATTPKTAGEAAQKVEQLGQQLESVSEDVNASWIKVGKLKKALASAKQAASVADRQYTKLSDEVAKIVRSTYTSAPFGQFTTLMTSDSPENFLAQLATLERMSEQRARVIGSVLKTKQDRDKAKAQAASTFQAASKEYMAAVSKQKGLNKQIVQYKALFRELSAREQARINGNSGGPASRDSRIPLGPLPPASGKAKVAVAAALSKRGDPYVWGAAGPNSFDCSGLTMWAWGQAGVPLPHQSAEQFGYGTHVPPDLGTLKPGDLLFYYSPTIHHVAIYIGNGQQVHAPTSGSVVMVVPVDWKNLVGATRLG